MQHVYGFYVEFIKPDPDHEEPIRCTLRSSTGAALWECWADLRSQGGKFYLPPGCAIVASPGGVVRLEFSHPEHVRASHLLTSSHA